MNSLLADTQSPILRRTPLYECHKRAGAKFTEFGGWDMPVQYSGLVDEHLNVRSHVGLFDVSHMGEISVRGKNALQFLNHAVSNDVSKLERGRAQYALLLNEKGGVVDDIIIYKFADDDYFLCVNAANSDKDFAWLSKINSSGVKLDNVSSQFAQIAVQGPNARALVGQYLGLTDGSLGADKFPPFTFCLIEKNNSHPALIIAATGYTGEDGFEIFCPSSFGAQLWDLLMEKGKILGVKPAGLGARDTLRLEACLPLHGHELGENLSALSSNVTWAIKFKKDDFVGKNALVQEKKQGVLKTLVGLEVLEPGIIRHGTKLFYNGKETGWVASGTKPPTVNKAIGMAFVPAALSEPGTELEAEVRERRFRVRVASMPFYSRKKIV